jgi:hypothetical protein
VVCGGHSIQEVFVDTYIIRIYRREENGADTLVGTVEEPGVSKKKPFVNPDQLWNILNLKKKKMPNRKRSLSRL